MSVDLYDRAADILDPPDWEAVDRPPLEPHQVPPEGLWDLWVLRGGRGSGKTEAGARWFARAMRKHPKTRGRIVGPTLGDVFESCIDGPSGLRYVDPEVRVMPSAPGGAKVIWPNGSEALLLGTPTPREVDRLRASGNREFDWWEEGAANPQLEKAFEQAAFGLRMGEHPQSIMTTTPRPTKAFRELLKERGTVQTHGTIDDNPHLTPEVKAKLKDKYAGTRIGRQELEGELLTDVPGALWSWDTITVSQGRWHEELEYTRIVIPVDPAVTSGEEADEVGIVPVGKTFDGLGCVIADRSCQGLSPNAWAKRVVSVFDELGADRVIGEVNNGGELVEAVIRQVRPNLPYKAVRASRGKIARAEPIAAQFEQGKWIMAPHGLELLIEEMTTYTGEPGQDSPNRLDSMVWGAHEIAIGSAGWRFG